MIKMIYVIALLGVVASCNFSNSQYTNQLKSLDSKLEQYPEMVWDSLKKLDPKKFNSAQQAYYYLLSASATDKNLVYLDNDSTIRVALEYYQDQKDNYNLARCQYYMGKYVQKRKKIKEAYEFYKQAELNFQQSEGENPHILGLIHYQIGLIQKQQINLAEAEVSSQKAFEIFVENQDTISSAYALRLKGSTQIDSKKLKEAEENLSKSLEIILTVKNKSKNYYEAKSAILSAFSLLYRKTKNLQLSLEFNEKYLAAYFEQNHEIPSLYYNNILNIFNAQQEFDSAKYYCDLIIKTAEKEKNTFNLMNGYKASAFFEAKKGNYKQAYLYKEFFNKLKDSLSDVKNSNNILELENEFRRVESQKKLLKAENNNLRAYAIFTVILFGLLIIGVPLYSRHKRLKLKYHRLSEAVKHTEWGFLVTKEFITENHIAYDELERMLNREKSLNNINVESYNRLREALIQQKANYSGHLFDRLTSFDGTFGTKFQQSFPEFSTDELLMASMVHHQWKITDMTTIFHVSVEAIRKRKARLAHKISMKLKKEIDIDDYLTNL